jgi:hypothetical protein
MNTMKKQSIETLETCKLSSSDVNNILGGETCGSATGAGTANCGPEGSSSRCFYSSDQYTWDCDHPEGPFDLSYNWGRDNDASPYATSTK